MHESNVGSIYSYQANLFFSFLNFLIHFKQRLCCAPAPSSSVPGFMCRLLTIKNPPNLFLFARPRNTILVSSNSLHFIAFCQIYNHDLCLKQQESMFLFPFIFYNVLLLEECYCAICPKQPDKQVGFPFSSIFPAAAAAAFIRHQSPPSYVNDHIGRWQDLFIYFFKNTIIELHKRLKH